MAPATAGFKPTERAPGLGHLALESLEVPPLTTGTRFDRPTGRDVEQSRVTPVEPAEPPELRWHA